MSQAQIDNINQLSSEGKTKEEIARVVGLAPMTVYQICRKNGWELPKKRRSRKASAMLKNTGLTNKADTILEVLAARESGVLSEATFTTILRAII